MVVPPIILPNLVSLCIISAVMIKQKWFLYKVAGSLSEAYVALSKMVAQNLFVLPKASRIKSLRDKRKWHHEHLNKHLSTIFDIAWDRTTFFAVYKGLGCWDANRNLFFNNHSSGNTSCFPSLRLWESARLWMFVECISPIPCCKMSTLLRSYNQTWHHIA